MSRRASNPPELKELIAKLRAYRLNKGLTEKVLAEQVGVTFVTLNRWFNGHTLPDELHAHQIRQLLRRRKQ